MYFLTLSSHHFTKRLRTISSCAFRISSSSVGRSTSQLGFGFGRGSVIGQVRKMGSSTLKDNETLFLFDVDGTLTPARQIINPKFYEFLTKDVASKVKIGIVGGSDLVKILEQLNVGDQALRDFDYVFSENGLMAHGDGKLIGHQSILKFIGEEKLQEFINFSLGYLAKLKLPCKRGNFIEFRNGMINVCPVGRSCSQEERMEFVEFDKANKVRDTMIAELRKQFPDIGMQFSIGGQISIDAFPRGWDKTYALNYLQHIPKIHFFGDKTNPGENDYEIFSDDRTIGHTVLSPEDTEKQVREVLGAL